MKLRTSLARGPTTRHRPEGQRTPPNPRANKASPRRRPSPFSAGPTQMSMGHEGRFCPDPLGDLRWLCGIRGPPRGVHAGENRVAAAGAPSQHVTYGLHIPLGVVYDTCRQAPSVRSGLDRPSHRSTRDRADRVGATCSVSVNLPRGRARFPFEARVLWPVAVEARS
jgi:hypothetical protein